MLYGREREVQDLVANLRHGVHTLVFGPSGSGKSALLLEAARLLSSNQESERLVAYVGDCSSRKVLLKCALDVLAGNFGASVFPPVVPGMRHRGFLYKDLRNALIRISREKHLCLILDHFPKLHYRMRHLLEMLEEHCTLACGVTAPRCGYDLYFWKFAALEVHDLPRESALSWIDEEIGRMGYEGRIRQVIGLELLRLTNRNPGSISRTLDVIRTQRVPLDDPIRVRRMLVDGRIRTEVSIEDRKDNHS
jgi:energy-coupling factor transporter ATP-binding protein EcfA2